MWWQCQGGGESPMFLDAFVGGEGHPSNNVDDVVNGDDDHNDENNKVDTQQPTLWQMRYRLIGGGRQQRW